MTRFVHGSLLIVLCTGVGCSKSTHQPVINDLKALPQDCRAYVQPDSANQPIISAGRQEQLLRRFREAFFEPWGKNRPCCDKSQLLGRFEQFDRRGDLYGSNLQKLQPGWTKALQTLANLEQYPNCRRRAITLRNTNLRELPTAEPHFESIDKPGCGYPFDVLQSTALWAGTPLWVVHIAGGWAFVDSPAAAAWMPLQDLAFVDDGFVQQWRGASLAAVTSDRCAILDANAMPRLAAHIGTVLPLVGADDRTMEVLVPVADQGQRAVALRGRLSRDDACAVPCPLTAANVARIANHMLGQPYGWGGLYENRDCSATTRDLFVPFGLWLPRNSSQQAKAGDVIDLKYLPGDQKERLILQKGVPWLTLLHSPGHIMLYIGQRDGRAIILHNFWGIITSSGGREARRVVGRCVITTLQPGIELPDIALPQGDRRNVIERMILLAPLRHAQGGVFDPEAQTRRERSRTAPGKGS
jgi:cell wall-associated NlpC family hydrolase